MLLVLPLLMGELMRVLMMLMLLLERALALQLG